MPTLASESYFKLLSIRKRQVKIELFYDDEEQCQILLEILGNS